MVYRACGFKGFKAANYILKMLAKPIAGAFSSGEYSTPRAVSNMPVTFLGLKETILSSRPDIRKARSKPPVVSAELRIFYYSRSYQLV